MTAKFIYASLLSVASLTAIAQHVQHEHDHSHGPSHLEYVRNDGQWDNEVLFRANFPGASMFLEEDGILWTRLEDGAGTIYHDVSNDPLRDVKDLAFQAHAWKVVFVGANPSPLTVGHDKASKYHNYFLGPDPLKWAGEVPVFAEVRYQEVWPGIDLRWHGEEGRVKYDVILSAGSNPGNIGFRYDGLDEPIELDNGELVIRTSVGTFREMRPVVWYADDNSSLDCDYRLENGVIRFDFPNGIDQSRDVIIDPLLMGATYSNVVGNDIYGHTATYDDAGNIYSGGQSFGPGLPTSVGAFQATFGGGFSTDIAINKFTPDATAQIWATYIGGNADEKPHSMIVNVNQELTVLGSATGPGYPTSGNAYSSTYNGGSSDVVVTRLNSTATALVGSTYVGGSDNDGRQDFSMYINYGDTYRGEVMLDAAGNTFVASCSQSIDFPVSPGAYQGTLGGGQDGVVFGLTPNCSALIWSTYLGGSSGDNALGLRFDASGDVFAVGGTESADFPNGGTGYQNVYQGGDKDGYVVKLSGGGSTLSAATFFGTTGEDISRFIDLDNNGDIWIYGQSDGGIAINPATTYGQVGGDIFLAKFEPTLANTLVTTSLGPGGGFGFSLVPVAFLVDICDHVYISGYSPSSSWTTTPNALYPTGGGGDFYLAAYDVDLVGPAPLFGSFYGGSHVDGGTSRFDKNGIIYQGVCSGGNSMPTSPGAYAPVNNVGWDIGVFKIDFQVAGVNAAGAGTQNSGCAPITINFINNSTGNQFLWNFGDGSPTDTAAVPSHTYTTPGTFTVMLIAMDSLSCNLADTIMFPITIGQAQPITAGFTAVPDPSCATFSVTATNTSTGTPLAFQWDMGDGSPIIIDTNVVHIYATFGNYNVTLIAYDPTGCSNPDTIQQIVNVPAPTNIDAGFTYTQVPDCNDLIVSTTDTTNAPNPSYQWDMGDGSPILISQNITHIYTVPGTYTITLIATDTSTCNNADTATAQVTVLPPDTVNADFTILQQFDCSQLIASTTNLSTGDSVAYTWLMGDGTTLTDTNAVHTYTSPGTYNVTLIVSDILGCQPPDSAFAQVTLNALNPVVAGMNVAQINDCSLLQIDGTNLSSGDSVSYAWTMGDGASFNTFDVSYQYVVPGTYTVQLLVTDLTGCNPPDSVSTTVTMVQGLPIVINSTAVICPDETITLDGTWPGALTYTWNTGATTPSIDVSQGGTYILTVTDTLCNGSDTISVVEAPMYDLYYEFDACPQAVTTLSVPLGNANSYSWFNGAITQEINVVGGGLYTYDLIDSYGCPHSDSIRVYPVDSAAVMYSPNAFTPDGDGINDFFSIFGYGEVGVEFTVWDRWGHLIHSANQKGAVWDGRSNGELVQLGVYVYRLKYRSFCEEGDVREIYGHVTVVR